MNHREIEDAIKHVTSYDDCQMGMLEWTQVHRLVVAARALLSSSKAEGEMREVLFLVDKGFRTKRLKDASIIRGGEVRALSEIVSAALSPKKDGK